MTANHRAVMWVIRRVAQIVQKRGAEVLAARKLSSALSAAKAIGDHLRDWWFGTKPVGLLCLFTR